MGFAWGCWSYRPTFALDDGEHDRWHTDLLRALIPVAGSCLTGLRARSGLIGEIAAGSGSRRDWTRRTLVLAALIVGAACSGLLVVNVRRAAPALPLATTIAVLAAAVYVLPSAEARAVSDAQQMRKGA